MTSRKGITPRESASYHRFCCLSSLCCSRDCSGLSLFLPVPNTRDQKPRFFFGCSAVGAGGGGSGATPLVAAVCGGIPVSSIRGGADFSTDAIVPKKLRVEWRRQVVVGSVPRAKYSV